MRFDNIRKRGRDPSALLPNGARFRLRDVYRPEGLRPFFDAIKAGLHEINGGGIDVVVDGTSTFVGEDTPLMIAANRAAVDSREYMAQALGRKILDGLQAFYNPPSVPGGLGYESIGCDVANLSLGTHWEGDKNGSVGGGAVENFSSTLAITKNALRINGTAKNVCDGAGGLGGSDLPRLRCEYNAASGRYGAEKDAATHIALAYSREDNYTPNRTIKVDVHDTLGAPVAVGGGNIIGASHEHHELNAGKDPSAGVWPATDPISGGTIFQPRSCVGEVFDLRDGTSAREQFMVQTEFGPNNANLADIMGGLVHFNGDLDAGVRVHRMGRSGWPLTNTSSGWAYPWSWLWAQYLSFCDACPQTAALYEDWGIPNPTGNLKLAIVGHLAADVVADPTAHMTYASRIRYLCQYAKEYGFSVLFVVTHKQVAISKDEWGRHTSQLYALADEFPDNVSVLDVYEACDHLQIMGAGSPYRMAYELDDAPTYFELHGWKETDAEAEHGGPRLHSLIGEMAVAALTDIADAELLI